jgi:CubicO group peptidase (beta-lactamase class C family)
MQKEADVRRTGRPILVAWAALALCVLTFAQTGERAGIEAAERRVKELADVLSTQDAAKLRQYIETTFAPGFLQAIPVERHVEILSGSQTQHGGFVIPAVVAVSKTSVAAYAQSRKTQKWFRVTLEVEGEQPYLIRSIGIMAGSAPAAPVPTRDMTDEQMVENFRAVTEKAASEDRFSGAVLIAKADKVLFKAAYGDASKRYNVKNQVDTKFNLGSMNKMFTAVAIAQLEQAGKVAFDDPIGKYLTDWVSADIAAKVRIHHLLTHTSGLGSYFNDQFEKSSRLLYRDVNDNQPLVKDEKLAFEPGTKWSYSNTGFLLLGAIVEKVSGQSYFDYVREHIYKPAGMTNTDCYDVDGIVTNLATGYDKDQQGRFRDNTLLHVVRGGPAGGGYSTVEDLHRFALALHGGKLLDAKHRDLVTTPKPESQSPDYGYGFQTGDDPPTVGHGGGFPGISSRLSIYTKDGYVLAVLSNYSGGTFELVSHFRSLVFARAD